MKTVGIRDAKTQLSKLIESGEAVAITKHGEHIATLTPVRKQPHPAALRIRELRKTGGVTLSEAAILELTRAGRR